jgi:hypothetical protein
MADNEYVIFTGPEGIAAFNKAIFEEIAYYKHLKLKQKLINHYKKQFSMKETPDTVIRRKFDVRTISRKLQLEIGDTIYGRNCAATFTHTRKVLDSKFNYDSLTPTESIRVVKVWLISYLDSSLTYKVVFVNGNLTTVINHIKKLDIEYYYSNDPINFTKKFF